MKTLFTSLWEGAVEVYTDLALALLEAILRFIVYFGATAGVMAGIYAGLKFIPQVHKYLGL